VIGDNMLDHPTTLLRRNLPDMKQANSDLANLITQMAAAGPNMVAGTSPGRLPDTPRYSC
jgi:hypothetical protein